MKITVPQLFTPPPRVEANGRMVVNMAGDGAAHATATYEHELLADGLTIKKMLLYRARSMQEFDGWVRHEGEEILLVLTDVIRLYTEFYAPVGLRRGDSAYYDATMGHSVVSVSQEDATIHWVTSLN